MPHCTQISHRLETTFSLLLRLIQSSSIRNIWCFLPSYALPPVPHALPPFLSLSLQIRAAKLYCYFIQAGAATGGPAKAGYLVNGALLWAGDTSWSSPIFLIECFNTSYRETAVLQISMFSVTMINVLLRLCRSLTISKGLFSSPPSQHRHLNTTHTYIQHTHTTHTY